MKNIFTFLLLVFIGGQFLWGQPANLVWNPLQRIQEVACSGYRVSHRQMPVVVGVHTS